MDDSLTLVQNTLKIDHFLDVQPSDFYLVTHHGLDLIAKPAQHFRMADKKKAVCGHLSTPKDLRAKTTFLHVLANFGLIYLAKSLQQARRQVKG